MGSLLIGTARFALSSGAILDGIRSWAGDNINGRSAKALDEILAERLLAVVRGAGIAHYHQVELSCAHLGKEDPASGAFRGHWRPIERCLLDSVLSTLSDALLCEAHGRICLRWDALSTAQGAMRCVEVSQLSAFMLAERGAGRRGPVPPSHERDVTAWARDGVIPPVSSTLLDGLAHRGLVDVHRHLNISMQPVLLWARLMGSDRAPSKLTDEERGWVRSAQRLRGLLRWALDGSLASHSSMARGRGSRVQNVEETLQARVFDALHSCSFDLAPPAIDRPFTRPSRGADDERRLLVKALEWLLTARSDWVCAAVYSYLLLQNLVLGKLAMPIRGSEGLDHFVDKFQAHPIRDELDNSCPERLVQAYRAGRALWVEGRVTPKEAGKKIDGLLDAIAQRREDIYGTLSTVSAFATPRGECETAIHCPNAQLSLPGLGLIFHFVRRKDEPVPGAFSSILSHPVRNEQERYQGWQDAEDIGKLLACPDAGAVILGLDICGSEAWTAMGTFAPQVRYLRDLGRQSEGLLGSGASLERYYEHQRIGVTCHAGEDFAHVLSGLRHIDEAIEFYGLEKGDRLGHALALGLDVRAWAGRLGYRCIVRKGEWLDDLVWFHHYLTGSGGHEAVRQQVGDAIRDLAREVYPAAKGKGLCAEPSALFTAWRMREHEPVAEDAGQPASAWPVGARARAQEEARRSGQSLQPEVRTLWGAYHSDSAVREAWNHTMLVDLNHDWDVALDTVQTQLTRKVVGRNLIIEVNPSSNLTIGPFDTLTEHPIFRWLDPRRELAGQSGPLIVIGSDDPSAFGTELIHEYAFLGRAAEELGATPRQIQAWLEHLRQASFEFSFFRRAAFGQVARVSSQLGE
jgi:hypothetical protein